MTVRAPKHSPLGTLFCLFALWFLPRACAAEPAPLLHRWLATATNLVSWEAGFTQTRHLKALTQPLVSTGRVWFAAPDKFRWELGRPAQSLVLRDGAQMQMLSPRLKRAEVYDLETAARGPMRDLLTLIDTGFPRDAADFTRQFRLVETLPLEGAVAFRLEPRLASARRLLPGLRVEVDTNTFLLRATELTFTDGSRLRNDFAQALTNVPLDAALFTTNLTSEWKITRPAEAK